MSTEGDTRQRVEAFVPFVLLPFFHTPVFLVLAPLQPFCAAGGLALRLFFLLLRLVPSSFPLSLRSLFDS